MRSILVNRNENHNFQIIDEKRKINLENDTAYKNIHQPLIDGCLKNDADAQRKIYELYSVALFNTCKRILANRDDAQDILQETFIDAFKGINTYSGKSALGAWLKRIAVNKSLQFLKKQNRINFESLGNANPTEKLEEENFPDLSIEMINEAILKLPDGCRSVFVLKVMEDYEHSEIAEEMQISVGTSKSQFNRARQLLQVLLRQPL